MGEVKYKKEILSALRTATMMPRNPSHEILPEAELCITVLAGCITEQERSGKGRRWGDSLESIMKEIEECTSAKNFAAALGIRWSAVRVLIWDVHRYHNAKA